MDKVLTGEFKSKYDKVYIIDCRFAYEFDGGHIKNAHNINSTDILESYFFKEPIGRALIIFHCEYSVQRAPRM